MRLGIQKKVELIKNQYKQQNKRIIQIPPDDRNWKETVKTVN